MSGTKISAGADPVTVVATDKVPMARSASTTAYAATMTELAAFANTAYVPNYFTGTPSMDATGAPGTAAFVSRGDHVHPSDTTRVAKGGDTMTGLLTLSGAPTANLHAATKLYVDGSAPVGGPYLPLVGGTLTGALTPTQTGGLIGTTTNNNASTGSVGEYLSSAVAGPGVPNANGTAVNMTSLSLTAGDWDVQGNVVFNPSANNAQVMVVGLNTVSATLSYTNGTMFQIGLTGGTTLLVTNTAMPTGRLRVSVAATTTVYIVAAANYASGSCTVYGYMDARRVR